MDTKKVVSENIKRVAKINCEYQPHTGKGCYGERRIIHLPDSPIPLQYIPAKMEEIELVSLLRRYGSIQNFIKGHLKIKATPQATNEVWKHWIKLRWVTGISLLNLTVLNADFCQRWR